MSKTTIQPRRCQFTVKGGGRCAGIAFHKVAGGSRVCMEHAASSTLGGGPTVAGGATISALYSNQDMNMIMQDKRALYPSVLELPFDEDTLMANVIREVRPSQIYLENFETGRLIEKQEANGTTKLEPEVMIRAIQYPGHVATVTDKNVRTLYHFLQKKFPDFRGEVA